MASGDCPDATPCLSPPLSLPPSLAMLSMPSGPVPEAAETHKDVKKPVLPAFDRLPEEIIQQILLLVGPNAFASLALLNAKWRLVSQQAHLYAHHLAACPSYAAAHRTVTLATTPSLDTLRRDFAREVKRNRFDAYLRPRRTLVRLVSNCISSSAAPGGDGMCFQASPRGHHLLAYNSSRIYLLDLRPAALAVRRELKILRRPAAVCIPDDASVLVVLLTAMQIDLYDLQTSPPRRTHSLQLDHCPRAIALSPAGDVLAAAYDGGIEVTSLRPGALDTDRRAVKCDPVDALAFSFDGTQILGTTLHATQPATVVLTAPYYDPASHALGDNTSLWTTSILFPNTSRDCSHAVLLQDSAAEEALWSFAYDRSFECFRAVRVDDLRNGTTYLTGPVPTAAAQARLLPSTLPAASYHGDLVAAGFADRDVWLYGVPAAPGAVPAPPDDTGASLAHSSSRASTSPSVRAASASASASASAAAATARVPQWQLLCDRTRNTFVAGCRIAELPGLSSVTWVEGAGGSSLRERLVVCARGVTPPRPLGTQPVDPYDQFDQLDLLDGGRLLLVDFDYGPTDGVDTEQTIEVGNCVPEELAEEHRDLATEVALVRRRTVAQRRGGRSAMMRAATTAGHGEPLPSLPGGGLDQDLDTDEPDEPDEPDELPEKTEVPTDTATTTTTTTATTTMAALLQDALDTPYAHASPRSGTTLRRAATAAALSRRLNPRAATTSSGAPLVYRRADGRGEHPHESDADNWVPPPPPYQKEDPQDMPDFMRHNVAPIAAPNVEEREECAGGVVRADERVEERANAEVRRQLERPDSPDRPVSAVSARSEDLYSATPAATPPPVTASHRPVVSLQTDLPPVPSLATAASWNVRQSPSAHVPRPLESVQTWPVRRPSGQATVGGSGPSSSGVSAPTRPHAPVEDQPLIISTPRGVTGAFDPPTAGKLDAERQRETPILAPVARHPRAQERSAMLRERLETMSGGGSGGGGSVEGLQQARPLLAPFGSYPSAVTAATAATATTNTTTTTTTTRQSSLSRRLSRAERSAAKNMLDAKKRGWRRKKSKKGKEVADDAGEAAEAVEAMEAVEAVEAAEAADAAPSSGLPLSMASLLLAQQRMRKSKRQGKGKSKSKPRKPRDADGASSAAWTDVTSMSAGAYEQAARPMGLHASSAYAMQQMQQQQQQMRQQQRQQYYEQQLLQGSKKNGKCALM